MTNKQRESEYLSLLIDSIRVCADYKPKLGQGPLVGYNLQEFQELYGKDPFYHWLGLDNPLMYAAHKAAGGMASIYRQIGIGCENLFRRVLKDQLNLTDTDVTWSYTVRKSRGKTRVLSLDGRIPLDKVTDKESKERVTNWIRACGQMLEVSDRVISSLEGAVFEVRQGYKSKDSKRQNADIANATTTYTKGYLPCVAILSQQIDGDVSLRYRNEKWVLLTGNILEKSPQISVYSFMQQIIGFDLADFLNRNSLVLKKEVDVVLTNLLKVK